MRITGLTAQAYASAADDFEDIDGATGGSRKIAVQDKHGQFRNAHPMRGGVSSDGSNTSAIASSALTNQGVSTDPVGLVAVVQVPSTNPGAILGCIALGANPLSGGFGGGDFYAEINTTGQLTVSLRNAANNAAFGATMTQNLVAGWGGKTVILVVTRSGATLTIYVNGVSYPFTTNGSNDTNDFSQAITGNYLRVGNSGVSRVFIGKIYSATYYNCALAAADVLEIVELGGGVPDRLKWAAQQVFWNNSALGVGAVDGRGMPEVGGCTPSVQSGARTGGAGSFFLRLTGGGNAGIRFYAAVGATIAISFWARADAANSGSTGCRFVNRNSTLGNGSDLGIGSPSLVTLDTTWRQFTGTYTVGATPVGQFLFINFSGGGLTYIEIDDFSAKITGGAVVHLPLDDGYSYLLKDQSPNKFHAPMLTTGAAAHVIPQNRPHHIRGTTSTNGNQQLWGANLIPANSQILRIRARCLTGTPTVLVGTSSNATDLSDSFVLSSTWQDIPLTLLQGSATSAVGAIGAGARVNIDVQVKGAQVGDACFVNTTDGSDWPVGLSITAFVVSTGQVRFWVTNNTASTINPGSRSYKGTVVSSKTMVMASDTSIWINANTADVIEWDIEAEPLSA